LVYLYIGDVILSQISDVDRVKRLHEIEKCNQEGMTNYEISTELSLPISTVERCQKYLDELGRSDITPEILSKKRSELYLELSEATEEAKKLFDLYKLPSECKYCDGTGKVIKIIKKKETKVTCTMCHGTGAWHDTKDANRFLRSWTEIIEKKAKLYGLDNVKNETTFQQFNIDNREYIPEMEIPNKLKKQTKLLADRIKESHENNLKREHDEEEV
jgi:hypothetical protein